VGEEAAAAARRDKLEALKARQDDIKRSRAAVDRTPSKSLSATRADACSTRPAV
jgi:hypothetical protein